MAQPWIIHRRGDVGTALRQELVGYNAACEKAWQYRLAKRLRLLAKRLRLLAKRLRLLAKRLR